MPPNSAAAKRTSSGSSRTLAWAGLAIPLICMAAIWGVWIQDAITTHLLAGRERTRAVVPPTITDARTGLTITVVAIAMGLIAIGLVPRTAGPDTVRLPVAPSRWSERFLCAAGLLAVALFTSHTVFLSNTSKSIIDNGDGLARQLDHVRVALAGMLEEPFFSALPVLALATVPARWLPGSRLTAALFGTFTLSALVRASLHLYQSWWAALAALVWGFAAIYAYVRFRSLVGLITAHTLWNCASIAQSTGHGAAGRGFLIALGALVATFVFYQTRVRFSDIDSPPTSVPVLENIAEGA